MMLSLVNNCVNSNINTNVSCVSDVNQFLLGVDKDLRAEFLLNLSMELSASGFLSSESVTLVFKKEVVNNKYFFELLKELVVAKGLDTESFFFGDFSYLEDFFKFRANYSLGIDLDLDINFDSDLSNYYFLFFSEQKFFFKFVNFFFDTILINQIFLSFLYICIPTLQSSLKGEDLIKFRFVVFDFMSVFFRSRLLGKNAGNVFINGEFVNSRFLQFSRKSEDIGSISLLFDVFVLPLRRLILILFFSRGKDLLMKNNIYGVK